MFSKDALCHFRSFWSCWYLLIWWYRGSRNCMIDSWVGAWVVLDTMAPPLISGYLRFIFVHWGKWPPLFGSMCRPGAGSSAVHGRVSPCSAAARPSLQAAGGGQRWPSGQQGWCSTWREGCWIWPPPEAPGFQLHTGQMEGNGTGSDVTAQFSWLCHATSSCSNCAELLTSHSSTVVNKTHTHTHFWCRLKPLKSSSIWTKSGAELWRSNICCWLCLSSPPDSGGNSLQAVCWFKTVQNCPPCVSQNKSLQGAVRSLVQVWPKLICILVTNQNQLLKLILVLSHFTLIDYLIDWLISCTCSGLSVYADRPGLRDLYSPWSSVGTPAGNMTDTLKTSVLLMILRLQSCRSCF